MGLATSKHINRIVIDPDDDNVVFVAAQGPLFGPGGERGVYKTTDGGKTWKQVLKVDDDTGANDLVMDPTNNKIMYASTYQRRRSPCCMNGGGPGSGIWKSTDAGETWTRLTGGLPKGALGRIGSTSTAGARTSSTRRLRRRARRAADAAAAAPMPAPTAVSIAPTTAARRGAR